MCVAIRLTLLFIVGLFGLLKVSHVQAFEESDNSIVILQYHHVSTETPFSTSISPEDFKTHLDYLVENNFEVISLAELKRRLEGAVKNTSSRTAVITFDDAYSSVFDTAWPLLSERNFPFSVFVNTKAVEQKNRYVMSWKQMASMAEQGVEFANHTHSHHHMIRAQEGESKVDWLARQKEEILKAEVLLKRHLGVSTKALAYPYGEYNPDIQGVLKELGYIGFAQHSGAVSSHLNSNMTALPRFAFGGHYTGLESFAVKVNSLALPVTSVKLGSVNDPAEALNQENWLYTYDDAMPKLFFDVALTNKQSQRLSCYASGQGRVPSMPINKEGNILGIVTYLENVVPVGRSRFNCTLPSRWKGRYYWFSQPIIRRAKDNLWYRE
jgi:peptidoglycan/xylan/chitin deacetylase (PgdA/CDA1 family)